MGGRSSNAQQFLYDPAEQAQWCKQNLPYFTFAARYMRRLRNKLVHKEIVTSELLNSVTKSLVELFKTESKASCVLELLLTQLLIVYKTIVLDVSHTEHICPLCRSVIRKSTESDEQIKNIRSQLAQLRIGHPESKSNSDSSVKLESPATLSDLKAKGMQSLKGSKIQILSGKFSGCSGI